MSAPRCAWCGIAFRARATGGSPQRFCSPAHRRAHDARARAIGERLLAAGRDFLSWPARELGLPAGAVDIVARRRGPVVEMRIPFATPARALAAATIEDPGDA